MWLFISHSLTSIRWWGGVSSKQICRGTWSAGCRKMKGGRKKQEDFEEDLWKGCDWLCWSCWPSLSILEEADSCGEVSQGKYCLHHIQVMRTWVTPMYGLSYMSTVIHSSAAPSYNPCLRGTCYCGDNYIFLYMSSYSVPWSVWKLPLWCDSAHQNTLYFPKTSTVLVIIIAEVLSIFKCFSSSPNLEIDDLALSFYCQLLKRPVLD